MRFWFVAAAVVSLPLMAAPSPQQREGDVIRVDTRLVEISAVVTGASDKPVIDLRKEEFTILDRGKPRSIAFFSKALSRGASASLGLPTSDPKTFSNSAGTSTQGSVSVVLIDLLNTSVTDQPYAREQVVKFIRQMRPEDRVSIYLLGNSLHILHDFVSGSSSLLAALKEIEGRKQSLVKDASPQFQFTGDPRIDFMVFQGDRQIAATANSNAVRITTQALTQIARHMQYVPGRKNLIWVTGGIPLWPRFFTEIHAASRALTEANVSIYPVDVRGFLPLDQARPRVVRMRAWDSGSYAMQSLAQETGGIAYLNNNDIAGAVRHAVDDAQATYTLGFYLSPEETDQRFHDIKVKVNRKGVNVRTRNGYLAAKEEGGVSQSRDQAISFLQASPFDATALEVGARMDPVPEGIGLQVMLNPARLRLAEQQPGGNLTGAVYFCLTTLAEDGRILFDGVHPLSLQFTPQSYQEALQQGFVFQVVAPATEATAKVKVIVYEPATGRAGSATGDWTRVRLKP